MKVTELSLLNLDVLSARVLGLAVRIGPATSGDFQVCWQVQRERQMWSPSTRWRQCARIIAFLTQRGTLVMTQRSGEAEVTYITDRGTTVATDKERMTVALVRCLLLAYYGPEIDHDIQVQ